MLDPKLETLNSKQTQMPKAQNSKLKTVSLREYSAQLLRKEN
jgi:hypothetical protein